MRSTSHWARTTYIEEGKKEISARHPYSRFTPSLLYPSLPFSLSLSPSPSLSHAHIRTSAGEAVEHSLRKPPLTKIWSDLVFLSTFLELFILKLKVKKLVEALISKKCWCFFQPVKFCFKPQDQKYHCCIKSVYALHRAQISKKIEIASRHFGIKVNKIVSYSYSSYG